MPEPTAKQIHYLHDLGYDGLRPQTLEEASAAIDAMLKTGDEDDAEQAIRAVRSLGFAPASNGCIGSLTSVMSKFVTALLAFVFICGGGLGLLSWLFRVKPDAQPAGREVTIPVRPARNDRPPAVRNETPKETIESPKHDTVPVASDQPPVKPEKLSPEEIERRERQAAKHKKADDEKQAQSHLVAAKSLLTGNEKAGRKRLQEVVDKWPETDAAKEARKILGK